MDQEKLSKAIYDLELQIYGKNSVPIVSTESIKTVLKAAIKGIAKYPLPDHRYYGNGKCPVCRAVFMDKSTNFCGNCGQALDWSGDGE